MLDAPHCNSLKDDALKDARPVPHCRILALACTCMHISHMWIWIWIWISNLNYSSLSFSFPHIVGVVSPSLMWGRFVTATGNALCAFYSSHTHTHTGSTSAIVVLCWRQSESNFCSINHSPLPRLPSSSPFRPHTHTHDTYPAFSHFCTPYPAFPTPLSLPRFPSPCPVPFANVDKTHFKLFRIAFFCLVSDCPLGLSPSLFPTQSLPLSPPRLLYGYLYCDFASNLAMHRTRPS